MNNQRVERIARGSPTSSSQPCASTTSRAPYPHLTPERLWAAWIRFVGTMRMVIRHYVYKTRLRLRLSRQGYEALVEDSQSQVPAPSIPQNVRIIGDEIVGTKLEKLRGGIQHADPEICEHPDAHMKRRGNGKSKSWTCDLCKTGWKRLPLNASETPLPTDLVMFGRHRGRTFLDIATEFPDYAHFVVKSSNEEPDQPANFDRLARFLRMKGKGSGKSVPPPRSAPSTTIAQEFQAWMQTPADRRTARSSPNPADRHSRASRHLFTEIRLMPDSVTPDTAQATPLPPDSEEDDHSMSSEDPDGEYPL